MVDDVVVNKCASIERCIRRVGEDYGGDPERLSSDITRQDAIVLNVQRACQAAIDLATHLVRIHRLGVPQDSREAFDLLSEAGLVRPDLAASLKRMVGFRNVAIHDYRQLSLPVLQRVIDFGLDDLASFAADALQKYGAG